MDNTTLVSLAIGGTLLTSEGGTTLGGVTGETGAAGAADCTGAGAVCECWLEAHPARAITLANKVIQILLAIFLDIGSLPKTGLLNLLSNASSPKKPANYISNSIKKFRNGIYIIYLVIIF
jgi:hypothetical protein